MRKIAASLFVSLDGVAEAPDTWMTWAPVTAAWPDRPRAMPETGGRAARAPTRAGSGLARWHRQPGPLDRKVLTIAPAPPVT